MIICFIYKVLLFVFHHLQVKKKLFDEQMVFLLDYQQHCGHKMHPGYTGLPSNWRLNSFLF